MRHLGLINSSLARSKRLQKRNSTGPIPSTLSNISRQRCQQVRSHIPSPLRRASQLTLTTRIVEGSTPSQPAHDQLTHLTNKGTRPHPQTLLLLLRPRRRASLDLQRNPRRRHRNLALRPALQRLLPRNRLHPSRQRPRQHRSPDPGRAANARERLHRSQLRR